MSKSFHMIIRCVVLVVVVAGLARVASAQLASNRAGSDVADSSDEKNIGERTSRAAGERPWRAGVSRKDRNAAKAALQRGNEFLKDNLFRKAAETYQQALRHWDHPRIHYNLSLALAKLDRPLDLYATLQSALKYGEAPLGPEKFEAAKRSMEEVKKRIAFLEVACDEPGAEVTLNGKLLFTGPGRIKKVVPFGEHSVAANKPGYFAVNRNPLLKPGEDLTLELRMFRQEDTERKRRWMSPWIPWSLVAVGVVSGGSSGFLFWRSAKNQDRFGELVRDCGGCVEDKLDPALRRRAEQQQIGAYITLGTATVALGAGVIMAFLNREETYQVSIEQLEAGSVSFAPVVSPDTAGFSATLRF